VPLLSLRIDLVAHVRDTGKKDGTQDTGDDDDDDDHNDNDEDGGGGDDDKEGEKQALIESVGLCITKSETSRCIKS
jgi:hypothetical protein